MKLTLKQWGILKSFKQGNTVIIFMHQKETGYTVKMNWSDKAKEREAQ